MIKFIVLSALLNTGEIIALPPESPKVEARRRDKGQKSRRRPGHGVR